MSKKENWVWMPHWGHFIGGRSCKFRLNTYVGGYVVSTVGEYDPERTGEFEPLGIDGLYETMVFKATRETDSEAKKCCPYTAKSWDSLDMKRYDDPEEARKGHIKLCQKWAVK